MRKIVAILAALALPVGAVAAESEGVGPPVSWVALQLGAPVPTPAEVEAARAMPDSERARRIEANKSYAIPAAEIVGFDVALNLFDRHHFGCCDFNSNLNTIRRNLRSSWVVDRDPFTVNQLGHPYQGSMYHGFARASGLDYWESLAYTFAGSAFWEIAGESTQPSRNDQINTGIGGSFFGEALFRLGSLVLERESDMSPFWREVGAAVLSPPLGFNRVAFGDRFRTIFPSHDPVYFSRLQLGFSGTAHNETGFSTTHLKRGELLADFLIDYGMPGQRGYEYTRPFDYFSLQATASSANGFENVLTRGLLKGREYALGKSYEGVWGLYGIYDYFAPQTYRVSSTAVALGTTARWWANDSVAVVGTVLLGVGYTAASGVRSVSDNDFHYGVAPQALAALRFIYRDKFALDIAMREYYVSRVAAASTGGHENIGRVDASLTWRVRGRHGVSLKYLGNYRDAYDPVLGDRSQHRGTIGIFYTLLGHQFFGATEK
jgi:hypothetical protein